MKFNNLIGFSSIFFNNFDHPILLNKCFAIQMFSGGIERSQSHEMG